MTLVKENLRNSIDLLDDKTAEIVYALVNG